MHFVAKSAPTVLSTIAQAGTSKPVSLHRLGTRKVAQSGTRVFRNNYASRSKFTNEFHSCL